MLFMRKLLKEEFPVNDMGDLSWYLGCALERNKIHGGRYENDADSVYKFAGLSL